MKFELLEWLAGGQFGQIYKGQNQYTQEMVAIKLDKSDHLKHESRICLLLKEEDGFPVFKWFGKFGEWNGLVMNLMGASLATLRSQAIPPSVISLLGVTMMKRVQTLHKYDLVHRDIKPENFLFRLEDNELCLIDFGMTTTYKKKTHVPIRPIQDITGSMEFVSLNVHKRLLPSRRDDIESAFYVFLWLWIPWPKGNESTMIAFKEQLFLQSPPWIHSCLASIRSLQYEDTPPYSFLIQTIQQHFQPSP